MALLTPRAILERVAVSITQALATPKIAGPWQQSRVTFEQFGSRDPGEIEHHGFALQLPDTSPRGDRQHPDAGMFAMTELAIRWAHRLRPEAVAFDLLEAMDAETELVAAVIATGKNPKFQPQLVGLSRSTTRDGLVFIGEARFAFPHNYPLA